MKSIGSLRNTAALYLIVRALPTHLAQDPHAPELARRASGTWISETFSPKDSGATVLTRPAPIRVTCQANTALATTKIPEY